MTVHTQPAAIDSVKKSLVALKMPRALEILDATLRRVEQGEVTWIEALNQLLIEELTLRDNRRVSTALRMSRLTTVKTLAGFDFAFQPSLDRNRILALAELKFIDRAEVVQGDVDRSVGALGVAADAPVGAPGQGGEAAVDVAHHVDHVVHPAARRVGPRATPDYRRPDSSASRAASRSTSSPGAKCASK